ncbi:MAG: hypothetical protein KC589_09420 [Nanoarchaeota archaeon]|nr:hypothetical protein [Nanoarchaeota archaeon]
MHYIKDIFEENITEHAHNKFIRYSKGKFVGPLLSLKLSKNQVKLSASFHFTDEILYLLAEVLGNQEVHIKGTLIWNKDLAGKLAQLGIKYLKVTKSRGIFKYVLDNDVPIGDFVETLGKYNLLVNIKTDEFNLVTKTSFPKPNKEFKADFCKVTLPLEFKETILKEYAFDVKDKEAKSITISHEIEINEIELPKIENFEEARRLAKRIGKLKRTVIVNSDKPITKEIEIKV